MNAARKHEPQTRNQVAEAMLRETLRQIGPTTFEDVAADLTRRVRLHLVNCTTDRNELWAAWTAIEAAGLIAKDESGERWAWCPKVAVATSGAKAAQMGLFGDDD